MKPQGITFALNAKFYLLNSESFACNTMHSRKAVWPMGKYVYCLTGGWTLTRFPTFSNVCIHPNLDSSTARFDEIWEHFWVIISQCANKVPVDGK